MHQSTMKDVLIFFFFISFSSSFPSSISFYSFCRFYLFLFVAFVFCFFFLIFPFFICSAPCSLDICRLRGTEIFTFRLFKAASCYRSSISHKTWSCFKLKLYQNGKDNFSDIFGMIICFWGAFKSEIVTVFESKRVCSVVN